MTIFIQPFFDWLVQTTLIASVVICLILLIQKAFGHRLGPRWCHALWLVLLIRMVLPWAPSSRFSLFNLIPSWEGQAPSRQLSETAEQHGPSVVSPISSAAEAAPAQKLKPDVEIQEEGAPESVALAGGREGLALLHQALPILWLLGAVVFGAYLLVSDVALWRIVKRDHPLLNQPMLELFEECKAQMGVQSLVVVVPSDQVRSPGLFGFVRPRLLLPRQIFDTATRQEMRYIFLHELAHLKRHDIYLGWLASLLQVLHWFNPLVWFAFYRMRTDRELACDALVLTRTGQDKSQEYGGVIVGLLRRFSRCRSLPAMAGIIENRSQLKRRIAMIARFKDNSYRWSPTPGVLICVLACLALPDARKNAAMANEKPADITTTPVPAQQPVFRKIRNLRGYDAPLSPDGKSIALGHIETRKLCIIPRDSTVGPNDPNISHFFVNTAEIEVDSLGLAWSGNGQWIAFNGELVLTGKQVGNQRMYVVSAQGGKPKEVCDAYRGGLIHIRRMRLSPDGKTLAFSAQDANELHVYTIPVEGGTPKRLVEVPAREPVFSPDGRMIAYVEDKNAGHGGGALWIVPAGGGTPRRVADAKDAWSPVWSPDGRMIAFFDFGGDRKICIIPVNERGEPAGEKITIDNPKGAGLLWRLTGWTPDNKIGIICSNPAEIGLYTLSPNGGPATLVTHTERGSLRQPRWSPDRKRIIYVKWPCEDGSNWVLGEGLASIAAEGGEVTMIPIESDTKIFIAPWGGGGSVSPDGKNIVFAGCKAQEAEAAATTMYLWTISIEGGKATQLTNAAPPLTDRYPCWSPDGKAIAFIRSRSSQDMLKMWTEADVYIIPSTGGEPRQLTSESDRVFFGSIAWSPDGKLLAYQSEDNELSPTGYTLRVIPAKGGESRVVAKLRRCESPGLRVLAWSPDSRRIAFNDGGIQIISLDDGRVEDIDPGVTATKLYDLDWSRDGARLVFAGYEGGGNGFWLMENFLPQDVGK